VLDRSETSPHAGRSIRRWQFAHRTSHFAISAGDLLPPAGADQYRDVFRACLPRTWSKSRTQGSGSPQSTQGVLEQERVHPAVGAQRSLRRSSWRTFLDVLLAVGHVPGAAAGAAAAFGGRPTRGGALVELGRRLLDLAGAADLGRGRRPLAAMIPTLGRGSDTDSGCPRG